MATTTIQQLVNSIYPVRYFSLPGVDKIDYPDNFWWSSAERWAALADDLVSYKPINQGGFQTSEILELDLGSIREINYINFDVLRAPIDIKIEYDIISTPDRDAVWLPVTPVSGQDFDSRVSFDPNNRTSWLNADFVFTDAKGFMVHTRYIRITFTRRDEPWPSSTSSPFQWPVFAKHMRVGRTVTGLIDTVGPILSQDTPLTIDEVDLPTLDTTTSREVRQQFIIPASEIRAGQTPNILGAGVMIQTSAVVSPANDATSSISDVSIAWSIWDVTNPAIPTQIVSGVENEALVAGMSWLDFYLDDSQIITGDTTKIYELRVQSLNVPVCDTVFTHSPNQLSNQPIPGTLHFTNASASVSTSTDTTSVVKVGSYIVNAATPDQPYLVDGVTSSTITLHTAYGGATATAATGSVIFPYSSWDSTNLVYSPDASKSLVMRVWSDVADSGRDVLGNAYRYVVRRQESANVLDLDKAGWMSMPQPSPDAVEALYFDVRGTDPDNGQFILSVVSALEIAPRTPGVRMNVYYSQQGLRGTAPVTTNDWDYLMWTPVQQTYTLNRKEIIEFPQPFQAAFIKLEFTALNPLPYRLRTNPPMPPATYRRFPTWVEDQFNNTLVRTTVTDWFLQNATQVQINVLAQLSDPVLEFEYEQSQFLAALALGQITDSQTVNSGIVDVQDKALIDPVTGSKIYLSFDNQYQNTLLLSVDQTSLLGQAVVNRYDPTLITDPIEMAAGSLVTSGVPFVSTTNDRVAEAYQNLAQVPMRFNKPSRHLYTFEQADFNKKAYFVGIERVRFLRNDFTVEHDDPLIVDNLLDDAMLSLNLWTQEQGTSLADPSTVFVTYEANGELITDEQVVLSGFEGDELATKGTQLINLQVFSGPNKTGVQYFQNYDYELFYGYDVNGYLTTTIQRSPFGARLVPPLQAIIYVDAGTVIGIGVIPSQPTTDAGMVSGVGVPINTQDGPFQPDYGAGTYGGGTYGDLTKHNTETASVVGHGVPSGTDTYTP